MKKHLQELLFAIKKKPTRINRYSTQRSGRMLGLFPTYGRFDLTVESAEGVIIKDIAGKSYIDVGAGIGVDNLGRRPPAVESAVEEQVKKYWRLSNLSHIP